MQNFSCLRGIRLHKTKDLLEFYQRILPFSKGSLCKITHYSALFCKLALIFQSFDFNKTENTFSLQSVSQNLQYTNVPINRVHKFPKVEDTQLVQCPSHLSCPMSKFPKLSKPKLLKAQVTQSPSCPNCQKCKLQASKKTSPMAKNIYGPAIAKNISSPPLTKKNKFVPKFPRVEVSQNPSCPNFRKSKLLFKAS